MKYAILKINRCSTIAWHAQIGAHLETVKDVNKAYQFVNEYNKRSCACRVEVKEVEEVEE